MDSELNTINITGEVYPKGSAGTITIRKVITTEPGTEAKVLNIGTKSNAVLDIYIPEGLQGIQGIQGEKGKQGYSIIKVQKSEHQETQNYDTYEVLINDDSNTSIGTFDVYNGNDIKEKVNTNTQNIQAINTSIANALSYENETLKINV